MSMLISGPYYDQKTGENNTAVSIIIKTTSLSSMSIILEAIGGSFSNQSYTIEISDDKISWVTMRSVGLGTTNLVTNSFSIENQSIFSNPLHFNYVRFTIPQLGSSIKSRITIGGR